MTAIENRGAELLYYATSDCPQRQSYILNLLLQTVSKYSLALYFVSPTGFHLQVVLQQIGGSYTSLLRYTRQNA